MKKISILFSLIALLSSCMPKPQNKYLTYQNIVILSDMSDRLDSIINGSVKNQQYPPKDIEEIHSIIQYFKNECVKPGEKIGDKSSIYFSTFSEHKPISIDIGKIGDLGMIQQFINSTGEFNGCGLSEKLIDFEKDVNKFYATEKNPGLDLISMLIEKIENKNIVKQDNILTNGIDTTFIHYENHIYIFTDGYLEYAFSQKQKNSQYYYGNSEIEKVRKFCMDNGVDIKTALEKDNALCLPACTSTKNQYINLHVFETHERDKDSKFNTYKYSKGLRDNEILEAVWRKWASESSFKSFEWKKY